MKSIGNDSEKLNVSLLQDEAAFIALHIVNASADGSDMTKVLEITKLIGEIETIVKRYYRMEFENESVYYYRFVTHLKFLAQRLVTKRHMMRKKVNCLPWSEINMINRTSV